MVLSGRAARPLAQRETGMKETLAVLEELKVKGLVRNYALGGGVAALFYVEPFLTYDLDAFVLLPENGREIVSLSPLYDSMFLDLEVLKEGPLADILRRHGLAGKWEELKGRLHGT